MTSKTTWHRRRRPGEIAEYMARIPGVRAKGNSLLLTPVISSKVPHLRWVALITDGLGGPPSQGLIYHDAAPTRREAVLELIGRIRPQRPRVADAILKMVPSEEDHERTVSGLWNPL